MIGHSSVPQKVNKPNWNVSKTHTSFRSESNKYKLSRFRHLKSKQTTCSDPGGLETSLSEADINAEAQRRLEQFLKESQITTSAYPSDPHAPGPSRSTRSFHSAAGACSSNDDFMTDDLSGPSDDQKVIYIKKIECKLNQTPLDQVEDNQRQKILSILKKLSYFLDF